LTPLPAQPLLPLAPLLSPNILLTQSEALQTAHLPGARSSIHMAERYWTSDQFLDLATAQRLETINVRDLVNLLARSGRLGYKEMDVVENDAVYPLVHEAHEGGPRVERKGHSCSDSTTSPQSYQVQESREPKRQKTDELGALRVNGPPSTRDQLTQPGPARLGKQCSNTVKRKGGVRMRGQRLMSATASGQSGPRPGTKVGTVLQVEAPAPRSSNFLKRPHIQHGIRPIPSTNVKQSQRISAQYIDLVIISDTEQDPSGEDEK
jgi:hypothetical protein